MAVENTTREISSAGGPKLHYHEFGTVPLVVRLGNTPHRGSWVWFYMPAVANETRGYTTVLYTAPPPPPNIFFHPQYFGQHALVRS